MSRCRIIDEDKYEDRQCPVRDYREGLCYEHWVEKQVRAARWEAMVRKRKDRRWRWGTLYTGLGALVVSGLAGQVWIILLQAAIMFGLLIREERLSR